MIGVALSNSSVFPEPTASCFEIAADVGFDGVEIMVGVDRASTDVDVLDRLSRYYGVPVVSIHAPTLLVTQNVWGHAWDKLRRSGEAAARLGAGIVVVHPPFRWQGNYAAGFVAGIAELNKRYAPVRFCVENMYPWGSKLRGFMAYRPGWDPTDEDYDHLTLDLSHASTARRQSLDYVRDWGERLAHVHLTDGRGGQLDEHLFPGEGDQHAWEVVAQLVRDGYDGQIVVEVNSRKAPNRAARADSLRACLQLIRESIARKPG